MRRWSRTIYRSLRGTKTTPCRAALFTDILRTSFSEEDAARQLDVAMNWGRYAELYDYDAARGQIIREEQGIGATIAEAPQPLPAGVADGLPGRGAWRRQDVHHAARGPGAAGAGRGRRHRLR